MALGDIEAGMLQISKPAGWFVTYKNETLGLGQIAWLDDDSGTFKKGDAIRTIENLPWLGGSGGSVESVTGTADRVDVDNTDPANPIINIAEEYDDAITAEIAQAEQDANDYADAGLATKQNIITGGASTITTSNLSVNLVLVSDASGKVSVSGITVTELGYLSGATSNLQNQINNINSGLSWKTAVRVATTANNTLSGAQTIDGISVIAGDRVLVKNQSSALQNGIYLCADGAWTRTTDADTGAKILQATVSIQEGSVNADTIYTCTTDAPITIGVTAIAFAKTSATTYTSSDGITLTGNNFTLNNGYFTGEVSFVAGAGTLLNSAVIGKVLTGYVSGAGVVAATDSILQAIQKLNGNIALKADLASPALTGTPTTPTASSGTNNTQIASTAFATALVKNMYPIASGLWRTGFMGTTIGASAGWIGNIYATPYFVEKEHTVTQIRVHVTTGVAASNIRLALYTDVGGYPTTLVEGSGNIASTGTAVLTFTFTTPQLLTGSIYWIAFQVSSNTVAIKYWNAGVFPYFNNQSNGTPFVSYSLAAAFGAFPTTFGAGAMQLTAAGTQPLTQMLIQ